MAMILRFPKAFQILLFLVIMLAGQTIATVHALEHSLEADEDVCFVCDAADNFQNSVSGHTDSGMVSKSPGKCFAQPLAASFFTEYAARLARGPPASLTF